MRNMTLGLPVLLLCLFSFHRVPKKRWEIHGFAQGTTYNIAYYADDSVVVKRETDSLLRVIDSSLSLYKSYSLVNRFNESQDGLVPDGHFRTVVEKAMVIHHETRGLFDITIYPLTDAWGFGPQKRDSMPDTTMINALLPCVNSDFLVFEGPRLVKQKPCVQLDPNGIAQGYSVDVLAAFLEKKRIRNYIVELGGEIRIRGRKPCRQKMSVGIEAPGDEADFLVIEKIIYPTKGAITTSGNYRRYYESKGQRITHLLDPRTGYPVANDLLSVTVYAKDAISADGYDNAIMGMGLQQGLAFVERHRELAAHFIFRRPDGTIGDTMSSRFRRLLKP